MFQSLKKNFINTSNPFSTQQGGVTLVFSSCSPKNGFEMDTYLKQKYSGREKNGPTAAKSWFGKLNITFVPLVILS